MTNQTSLQILDLAVNQIEHLEDVTHLESLEELWV